MLKLTFLLITVVCISACSNPIEVSQSTVPNTPTIATEITPTSNPTLASLPTLDELGKGWTKVEPGGETRCAHDTPYAYWVRPGSNDKLLLYFQGGGGCWNAETCAPGSTFYDDDVTAADDPNSRAGGVFALNNQQNPFKDHTIVYMPSCTGDVHWGDNLQEYPRSDDSTLEIYHRGFVNASAGLEWAYANVPDPESIFMTGCSAGAIGSIVHSAYVIEQYPDVPITQVGDSLALVDPDALDLQSGYGAHDNFPDWIPELQTLIPGELLTADYYAAIANHYPNYTFGEINSAFDAVQIRFYSALEGQQENFGRDLQNHVDSIASSTDNFRYYMAGGELHCFTPRANLYTQEIEGVRLIDWLTALEMGEDVESVQCEEC